MMQDLNLLSDDAFRASWRSWLETHYPSEWRRPITLRLRGEQEHRWLGMLFQHGWRAPAWPKQHGGLGLSFAKQLIYHQELEQYGAARFLDSGGVLLGPILIKYGTPAQQATYLPPILRGEEIWCQGYSEPGSGSDLASLRTTAILDGDHFVVNGSKIWTTMVKESSRMFLLVRTNKEAKKQAGISFLVMDMDTPGVTVRPIVNLAGEDEFGQVFFDNARIPRENLIHELNAGWTVAKTLLGTERITNGAPTLSRQSFEILEALTAALDLADDTGIADRRAALLCDLHDLTALHAQVSDAVVRGEAEDTALGLMKVLASELFQRISEEILRIAQEDAGAVAPTDVGGVDADLHKIFMIARPPSIYAGANEVQRNIVARIVLGSASR